MGDEEDRRTHSDSTVSADERAREGIEHLQAAAREVIAAARAMLDIAEEVVTDPSAVTEVLSSFVSLARTAHRATAPGGPGRPSGSDGWAQGDDDPGVQHIPVV